MDRVRGGGVGLEIVNQTASDVVMLRCPPAITSGFWQFYLVNIQGIVGAGIKAYAANRMLQDLALDGNAVSPLQDFSPALSPVRNVPSQVREVLLKPGNKESGIDLGSQNAFMSHELAHQVNITGL